MLVAVIAKRNAFEVNQEIKAIGNQADLIEIRIDFLDDSTLLEVRKIESQLPLIFTYRKKSEGGLKEVSEEERLLKIEELLSLQPAFCDLEIDTDPHFVKRVVEKFPKVQFIGSHHNFKETPQNLPTEVNPLFTIHKFAFKANNTLDLLRVMAFNKQMAQKTKVACMCMGEAGSASRVLSPIMGSFFTYAGLSEDLNLHRFSLKTLHEIYHFHMLNQETEIFALIGDSIHLSPGDLYHNKAFREKKQNAVYVKLKVTQDEWPSFWKLRFPFKGLSVTIPLKEIVYNSLHKMDQEAKEIGAVNTIFFKNHEPIGFNTDGKGALNALEKYQLVNGKKVAILGAGGTARSIAYEAIKRGAKITLYNRTIEKGESLAIQLGCESKPLSSLDDYEILINTIPASLTPKCIPKTIVMDVVYKPHETPLLKEEAKLQNCQCVYGIEMFEEQAKHQQAIWSSFAS